MNSERECVDYLEDILDLEPEIRIILADSI